MGIKSSICILVILFMASSFSNEGYSQKQKFPALSESRLIFQGDAGKWDADKVHTFSVVEANKDGYKYWAYYGLAYYGGDAANRKAGIARSNDLAHWKKYQGNPVIQGDCRWPTVALVNSVFYMFYAEYDENNDSRIVMLTSKDGINFGDKTVVVPRELGVQNQNPFILYNSKDGNFYLTYYHGVERSNDKPLVGRPIINTKSNPSKNVKNYWQIRIIKSKDINNLVNSKPKVLLNSSYTIASPSISYFNNKYHLTIETIKDGKWDDKWVTAAYESDRIDGKYKEVSNSPLLKDNDACAFQYIFDNRLYIFYSHALDVKKGNWELRVVDSKL